MAAPAGKVTTKADLKALKKQKREMEKQKKKAMSERKKQVKNQAKERKKQVKLAREARKYGGEYAPPPGQGAPAGQTPAGAEISGDGQISWARKSTTPMPLVEKSVDRLFETRGDEISKRWKEKYGEDFDIPEEVKKPRPDLSSLERDPTVADDTAFIPVGDAPAPATEEAPAKGRFGKLKGRIGKKKAGAPVAAAPADEEKIGFLTLKAPPKGMFLYQKFKDKMIIIKLIFGLISFIGYWPMLILRVPFALIAWLRGRKKAENDSSSA